MSRTIALPAFCLTCGYGQVPGENFNKHECADFRALAAQAKQANASAHHVEIRRRIAAGRATPTTEDET